MRGLARDLRIGHGRGKRREGGGGEEQGSEKGRRGCQRLSNRQTAGRPPPGNRMRRPFGGSCRSVTDYRVSTFTGRSRWRSGWNRWLGTARGNCSIHDLAETCYDHAGEEFARTGGGRGHRTSRLGRQVPRPTDGTGPDGRSCNVRFDSSRPRSPQPPAGRQLRWRRSTPPTSTATGRSSTSSRSSRRSRSRCTPPAA